MFMVLVSVHSELRNETAVCRFRRHATYIENSGVRGTFSDVFGNIMFEQKNHLHKCAPAAMKQNTIEMTRWKWLSVFIFCTLRSFSSRCWCWSAFEMQIYNVCMLYYTVMSELKVPLPPISHFLQSIYLFLLHITELIIFDREMYYKYVRFGVIASQVVRVQWTKYYSLLTNWYP
jgi:hypothetical protein